MSSFRLTRSVAWWCGVGLLCQAPQALANMGNAATTYGILPADIGTAQALSMFSTQVSATYYNPAYLARGGQGELTLGFYHADHELTLKSLGGPDPLLRTGGTTLEDDPSQQLLLGVKTDMSGLMRDRRPIYLGFMAGIERYGKEMLSFSSRTSDGGQFFSYGRQPLFLNVGVGAQLMRGIDVGASLRVTLHASADLDTYSDLGGETQYESLDVSAKPVFRPIVGVNLNWGELFCSSDCGWSGFETALVYKGYSNTRTKVKADAVIPGVIEPPGLQLALSTLDSFQPEIYSVGLQYQGRHWRVGVSGDWQRWSRLEDELRDDTIKDQADLEFRDTVVPRIGAELQLSDVYSIRAGVAYEKSPLDSDRSLDVNYLDNDRYVYGVGLTAQFADTRWLARPLRLDLGYQYHALRDRRFDLMSSNPAVSQNPFETVRAGGDVQVFSAAVSVQF